MEHKKRPVHIFQGRSVRIVDVDPFFRHAVGDSGETPGTMGQYREDDLAHRHVVARFPEEPKAPQWDLLLSVPLADYTYRFSELRRDSVLVVDSSDTPKLKVLDASADIDYFNFKIEEMEPAKQYKIKVTLKEGIPAGPFSGTITIQCDYPDARYRTLTVPVRGEIKK